MTPRKSLTAYGVAAAALCVAAAGGYVARAGAPGGPVNNAPLASAAVGAPVSFADIVQHVAPAVVSIEVEGKIGPRAIAEQSQDGDDQDGAGIPPELRRFFQQGPQGGQAQPMRGAGSGFFISADGYLVTNNHVIDHADKITVHTADNRSFKARLVGRDVATDLAVLKIDAGGLPFVSFEERGKPRVGDWVVAVGNPFNLGGTATAGIVSALGRRNVSGSSYVDYMQIDAPINRGNSGGPTFDLNGRVVGVNTAIYSPTGGSVGIGFDIPADVVAQVSRQLISEGKVTRGYIGATVQDVTPEIAESLGIPAHGALVAELTPGGPSATAGLQPGDLILKVNGSSIDNASDLTRHVGQVRAGEQIQLEVRREGQVRQVAVRSGLRPSEESLAANDLTQPGRDPETGPAVLGLQVAPDAQSHGVRVAGVQGDSSAADVGLRRGDLILRAGEHATHSPADLQAAVAEAKKSGKKSVLLFVARGAQHSFVPVEIGEG